MGRDLKKKVAVKISTGEPGGHNFLNPKLIAPLVSKLEGTIVECRTAYREKRFDTESHWQAIKDHGFFDIAPCDLMDEDGEIKIYFEGGKHLQGFDLVGSHIKNYNSMLMLSHFKGHAMGGFGGALKNMSIGVASRNGKAWIHSVGTTTDPDELWDHTDDQDGFLESMAEACKAVVVETKNEFEEIKIEGKFFGLTSQILRNGEVMGTIRRQVAIINDAFELEAKEEDIPFLIALVVALDNIVDKKKN